MQTAIFSPVSSLEAENLTNGDIFFEALKTSISALAILCMYKICLKVIEMNGARA